MSFVAILRAELFRLTRTRGGRVGLIVPALLGAAQVGITDLLAAAKAVRLAAAGEEVPAGVEPAFGPLADGLGGLGAMALVMIALLTGAFSLVRERDQGGLPLLALAGSRGAIVAGKTLGTCLYVMTALAALAGATLLVAAVRHDYGDVVEDGYVMATAGELWLEIARGVGAGLPALLGCVCFGVLVSAVTTGVGAAAIGAVLPFTLLALFHGELGGASGHLFVTYAPFFSEEAPLARLGDVARAFSDTHWEQGELIRAALVPAVEAVLFVVVAWLVTRKRDA